MSDPQLLYEDGPLFAVWKPPGRAVQAPAEFPSLELDMKAWLRRREAKEGNVYLGVPHRLDRPVSGVILFTRHVRAARKVSAQFEHRRVRKVYWACVEGTVEPAAGTWTDRLKKVYGKPQTEVVGPDDPLGREAVLHYRVRGHYFAAGSDSAGSVTPVTWLEIELETGRTHQIRIQAASRGHAVAGDAFYGAQTTFGPQDVEERERHIALHARSIALRHPMTNEPVAITAPLPTSWRALGLPLDDADYQPV
jgi:23S rRNA pseudouridine1911/1915/1917 synthase